MLVTQPGIESLAHRQELRQLPQVPLPDHARGTGCT